MYPIEQDGTMVEKRVKILTKIDHGWTWSTMVRLTYDITSCLINRVIKIHQ